MSSSISVWKKELGPNLNDLFLKKDLDNVRNSSDEKKKYLYLNTIEGEVKDNLDKKEKYSDFICRDKFIYDVNITCFPNYMHKSSLNIKKKFDICDLIIEVRDARLPFTSTNDFIIDNLKRYKNKKRIVILNKVDLISKRIALKAQSLIEEKTNSICLLTSSKLNKNISKIRDICKEIKPKFKSFGVFAMLVGLPNVGKSSIINSFKDITYNLGKYGHQNNKIAFEVNRKRVKTNVLAGTTKLVDTYKVSNNPLLYFIDTPGIFLPKMEDKEISLKLSALGNTLNYKYDHMYVGDYILFTLNKYKYYNYVKMLGLDSPTNDIRFVSNVISTKLNLCRNYKYLDINGGCRFFIDLFRLGLLGQVCLDSVPDKKDFVTYFDFKSEEPLTVNSQKHPLPFRGLL
ncbi:GTP-binding protein, putative [Plasmodium relictum]|uniref:GTP-binding protein, putative n=1 Tax=Plasmodium relictum TaxID=85471 RepID=A0A1J1HCY8_PLARL|nr:GTP-binding protein, putative [Plasmodium relictum]CRH03787.1 GTP-binding protein, putative [Plasmodium relictum]